ncbi:hypothetical protein OROMI_009398 [Orobanche minor]
MTLLLPVVISRWASYQLLATLEDALSRYVTGLTEDHVSSLACDSEEDGLFAFDMHSDGDRIIDYFRASLTPQNAEAVICTQDWIHKVRVLTSEEEYYLVQE